MALAKLPELHDAALANSDCCAAPAYEAKWLELTIEPGYVAMAAPASWTMQLLQKVTRWQNS